MGIVKEFKEFAVKGNVIDMAVGIIIGAAFGKIVSSVVNDILMPPLGALISGIDFKSLKYVMSPATLDEAGKVVKAEAAINYGNFINEVIVFTIVAFAVFLLVKGINSLKRKEAAAPAAPAAPPADVALLTEIRDLLQRKGT